ncbi:diacylglycerol kinase family enzyme [Streptomyces puniciscabiei]|uniref:Diacylglycerol kinase family enzyme n=1 Tax=Streptomyces puniciscabiei TaxID=164348 RepID=A0A542SZN5_9ACTN|nr:diacylglycerol kinase family enzyme [Streptomyces puniciscabiei]
MRQIRRPDARAADSSADRGPPVAWARLALLALLGSVLVLLVTAGLRGLLWVLIAVAGVALTAVGLWWVLAHSGIVRAAGAVVAVLVPAATLVLVATHGMLWPACLSFGLWILALAAARIAITPTGPSAGRGHEPGPVPAALHPWVVMNPRSGGGKVERFHLEEKARAAGARVVVLDPVRHQDVADLARRAVAEGADLLAVAGGDGTQALVAEVAARHDVPFMVIPAGTRNHFALDLGLDRDDPAAALAAFTDPVEFRVDLGFAADRVFVNNASFGTYAAVVREPSYRDAKLRTALQALPVLLTGPEAPRLRMRAGHTRIEGLQALLVSNNPYRPAAVDSVRPVLRESLDSGRLGVLCVRVDTPGRAARLSTRLLGGRRSPGVTRLTASEVVVEADTDTVPAGIDGESVVLPAPVVCRVAPGALRVRVPRHRPGTPPNRPPPDWRRVLRLALARPTRHRGSAAA